jgi:hypothetical protein
VTRALLAFSLLFSSLPVTAAPPLGRKPPGGPTVALERVVLTIPEIRDTETRSRLIGAGNTAVERSVALTLVARSLDGQPETILRLQRLTAVDDRGRLLSPPRQVPFSRERCEGLAPDERRLEVTVEGLSETARRVTIEGELVLAPEGGERVLPFRFPAIDLPLTNPSGAPSNAAGGLSLRLPRGISGTVAVALSRREGAGWGPWRWQPALPVAAGAVQLDGVQPGTYRITARVENGPSVGATLRLAAPLQLIRGKRGGGMLVR